MLNIIIRKWLLVFFKEAFITSLFVVCVKDSRQRFFCVFEIHPLWHVRIFTRSAIISALVSDVAWKITCFHVLLYIHISHTLHTRGTISVKECVYCVYYAYIFFMQRQVKLPKQTRNKIPFWERKVVSFFLLSRFVLWASDSLLHCVGIFTCVCLLVWLSCEEVSVNCYLDQKNM